MRSGAMMPETDRPKDVREDVSYKEAPASKNDQLFLLILYPESIANEHIRESQM